MLGAKRLVQVTIKATTCIALALASAAGAAPSAPLRVLTLAPHATELVYAAGAGDAIVGTVTASDYPAAARALPRVGDGIGVSLERVAALRPDKVYAWVPTNATRALAPWLKRQGIPLVFLAAERLDDIPAQIRTLGAELGTVEVAADRASALHRRIQTLRQTYGDQTSINVFVELGRRPLYTVGHDVLLDDALQSCGARNVYADLPAPSMQVSIEHLVLSPVQALIVPAKHPDAVVEAQAYWADKGMAAARSGHVIGVDPDLLFRPGPRLIDAVEQLCVSLAAIRDADTGAMHPTLTTEP